MTTKDKFWNLLLGLVLGLSLLSLAAVSVAPITLNNITGTLSVSKGGTGATTLTGLVIGNGASAFTATTTSAGVATTISDETGSGALTFATSPTLVTPVLGVATATSVNKVAITAPATSATLTLADGKTLTANNTLTFTGTDGSSVAFGAGGTAAYTANKLSVFAATTSAELAGVISDETGSGALAFATSPTFVTPVLGAASATSIAVPSLTTSSGTMTLAPASGSSLIIDIGTPGIFDMDSSFKVTHDGVVTWGDSAAHGQLTWDTGKAVVSGLAGTLEFRSAGGTWQVSSGGDFVGTTAGTGLGIKEGANCYMGTATLDGASPATVTVSTTKVAANSRIFLTAQTAGGVVSTPVVSARVAGTSFTITSVNTDTNIIAWMIVAPQ